MRTRGSARRSFVTTGAGVGLAVLAATALLLVGPLTLTAYAAEGAGALVDRYGTVWIALAGVVLLAATLVRRSRHQRPARVVATPEPRRLTLVRTEGQS